MADRAEPEIPQRPADGPKPELLPDEKMLSTPEISAPMLDVHASHAAVRSWKDFFIHIATITIGLLIAIGLEQSIEFFHHCHVREQLEDQMRGVFESNLKHSEDTFQQLRVQHAYFVDLADRPEPESRKPSLAI
jgi:hypothetical protein